MSVKVEGLSKILFFDIETACLVEDYSKLSSRLQKEWGKRANRFVKIHEYPLSEEEIAAFYNEKAAIFAEFSRVICISMGILSQSVPGRWELRIQSLSGKAEKDLLKDYLDLLNGYYFDRYRHRLCGHNIREFDVPFLCRRYLANGLPLPRIIQVMGQKSWQIGHFYDTLEMWKFGDYKHYTSLDLLCAVFGIPSPKRTLSGDQVNAFFWQNRLSDIVHYCEADLEATVKLFLKICSLDIGDDMRVVKVPKSIEEEE